MSFTISRTRACVCICVCSLLGRIGPSGCSGAQCVRITYSWSIFLGIKGERNERAPGVDHEGTLGGRNRDRTGEWRGGGERWERERNELVTGGGRSKARWKEREGQSWQRVVGRARKGRRGGRKEGRKEGARAPHHRGKHSGYRDCAAATLSIIHLAPGPMYANHYPIPEAGTATGNSCSHANSLVRGRSTTAVSLRLSLFLFLSLSPAQTRGTRTFPPLAPYVHA